MAQRSRKSYQTSKDIDGVICDFVQNHPTIWDTKDPLFYQAARKDQLFMELSQQLNMDHMILKERWYNIRHTFANNLKRVETSKLIARHASEIYQPTWPLYSQLEFLTDAVMVRLNKNQSIKTKFAQNMIKRSRAKMEMEDNLMNFNSPGTSNEWIKIEDVRTVNLLNNNSKILKLNKLQDSSEQWEDPQDLLEAVTSYNEPDSNQAYNPSTSSFKFDLTSTSQSPIPEVPDIKPIVPKEAEDEECSAFGRVVAARLFKLEENNRLLAEVEILQVLIKYLEKTKIDDK